MLPPTDIYTRIPQLYCAHDSHNAGDTSTNTFMESLERVGEGDQWYGVSYEMWGQVGDRGLGTCYRPYITHYTLLGSFGKGEVA